MVSRTEEAVRAPWSSGPPQTVTIYVGNLDHAATEAELRQAFEEFGPVSSATIARNRFTGVPRGFGFVEMPDPARATTAITLLDGKALRGRPLTVHEARPHAGRSSGSPYPPPRNGHGG